jgi:FlaA1/EpsC-like NDP-sugar epimerase
MMGATNKFNDQERKTEMSNETSFSDDSKNVIATLQNSAKKNRNMFIVLFQIAASVSSLIAAFIIRFEFNIPKADINILMQALPYLVVSRILSCYIFKVHAGSWQFVSMRDLVDTLKAVSAGTVIFIVSMVFIYRIENFPRSVFILEGIFNVILMGGSRFAMRYYLELKPRRATKILKNVLIVGAGQAGVAIINEIKNNPALGINIVGFVDDDPDKKGIIILGVPVIDSTEEIPNIVKQNGVDEIIIAAPSASYKDIMRIKNIALRADVRAKIFPSLGKMIQEDNMASMIRDVPYEDLLSRKTVKFRRDKDYQAMSQEIQDKTILITGAGGSIGSELCRQVIQYNPRTLILYERHENSLFEIEYEIRKEHPGKRILPVIGDILDSDKFRKIVTTNSVNLIYHAAAYKHVPMMEREPIEAIRNNIFGTLNVAKIAQENRVAKFVMISTDKAVNPANVMGTTKRIAERIILGLNGKETKFVAVRFGNVIGSSGSVIPRFKKQIAEGGPITVTHRDITRYFMSIQEAVQLVMTAGTMSSGGEIFLLDMGSPVKIADVAQELIRRSGLEPGKDIEIIYSGLRPGEKLYEELYWEGDGIVSTDNKKITMLKPGELPLESFNDKVRRLDEMSANGRIAEVIRLLKELVPETQIKDDEMRCVYFDAPQYY